MRGDEPLASIVSDDPTTLDRHVEEVRRGLESTDVHERVDAGRAFRVAAERDPEVVLPHLDTLVELLADEHGSLQLSGAIAIAELAADDPAVVVGTVPALTALLEETVAPAIEMAVIRALTRVGERSPAAIAGTDPVVADRLENATPPIRRAIVTVFTSAILEDPTRFPETIGAIEGTLSDDSRRLRRYAAAALSLIGTADPSTLSSVEAVLDRVETLEAHANARPWHHDETVAEAARRLRSLADEDDDRQ